MFETLKLTVNINLQETKKMSQKLIVALSPSCTVFCSHTTHHSAAMHPHSIPTNTCNNPTHHSTKNQTHRPWPSTPHHSPTHHRPGDHIPSHHRPTHHSPGRHIPHTTLPKGGGGLTLQTKPELAALSAWGQSTPYNPATMHMYTPTQAPHKHTHTHTPRHTYLQAFVIGLACKNVLTNISKKPT